MNPGLLTIVACLLSFLYPSLVLPQSFQRPRGIYLLGNLGQTNPDPIVLSKPHVDGFTLRILWEDLEPSQGNYQFQPITAILQNLATYGGSKRLTLEVFPRSAPDWVLAEPGVQTYVGAAIGAGATTTTLPYPWDEFTLSRWEAFVGQMANHPVYDPLQATTVPLASHSLLNHVDASVPGMGGVRDQGSYLVNSPGYQRNLLLPAINRSVRATVDRFPGKFAFIQFFPVSDGANPPLNPEIIASVRNEFFPDGGGQPRLGLFKENFSCTNPVGQASDALFSEKDRTYIMLQALQPWSAPFSNSAATDQCLVFDPPLASGWQTGNNSVDNITRRTAQSGPETGILHGIQTFNCYYFEMYLTDFQVPQWEDDLQMAHNLIWGTAGPAAIPNWDQYQH